jgi:hypothetical protein
MPDTDGNRAENETAAWQGALVGVGVGLLYGLVGFFALRLFESPRMGPTLFMLLPLVVGATIAFVTPRPVTAVVLIAGAVSLLICLGTLISLHAEGLLCALIAFPLIFVSLTIGVVLGILIRALARSIRTATMNSLVILAGPALVFGGHLLEMKTFPQPRVQSITTTMHLHATPQQVWANIQSLDSLAARKPFLMYVGLPIPQRCVLQGTAVGSKRICYFDQGFIEETILEWDPPTRMRLSIDRTNMPGRHWLDFDGAEYDLKPDADGTVIKRVTTIRSNLSPAWYWSRFETWGVQSEHEYLFSDLAGRFTTLTNR